MTKSTYSMLATVSLTAVFSVLASTAATAQTVYGIDSGNTSITLHKSALDDIGFTITDTSATTTPAAGYSIGFGIDTTTTAEDMFMFTADPDFTPGEGIIEHTGTLELNSSINIGNFVVDYDPGREAGTNSGYFLTDGANLEGQILYDIGIPDSNTFDGTEWHFIDADLFFAPEFAAFLSNEALSGTDAGDIRIDALTLIKTDPVPEPSTGLLSALGAAMLLMRRRR